MANWDTPGLTYDSGVRFDEPATPIIERKGKMKTKLNLSRLNIEQKVTLGNNVETALTGNVTFTNPNPSMATYSAARMALAAKNAAVVALQGQLKTAMSDRDDAEATFDALTT